MEEEPLDQGLGDQEKVLLVFGYLGPLALVSLVASRREFVKWHAKQGLALWVTVAALFPLVRLVQYVLDRFFWQIFGEIFRVGIWLSILGVLVALLVCVIRGLEGERFKLPLLGEAADRL
jgi:uncharacterized membrane protein